MRTNIDIDDALLAEVMTALGCRTKKATVEEALQLALRMHRQADMLNLVDPDQFWPGYDPEAGDDNSHDDWDIGAS